MRINVLPKGTSASTWFRTRVREIRDRLSYRVYYEYEKGWERERERGGERERERERGGEREREGREKERGIKK